MRWPRLLCLPLPLPLLLAAAPALALERWTTLRPGVRWLHRTSRWSDGAPYELHAVVVERCAPGIAFRATAPGEGFAPVNRWARRVGAVVALNGDYYDPRAHSALALSRGDGRWWPAPAHAEHRDALLAFDRAGALQVFSPPDASHPWLLTAPPAGFDARYTEAVPAREQVLREGLVQRSAMLPANARRHPRTGVGLSRDGLRWVFVVLDGRRAGASGARPEELGEVLLELGAWQGYKLDGGGSTSLYLEGHGVVNRPSDGVVRSVANHLGVVHDDAATNCAR